MQWIPGSGGRTRRLDHDGTSPTLDEMLDPRPVSRSITLTFHPMRESTLCTVVTVDRGGHRRWDRRNGTLVVPCGVEDLRGKDMTEVIQTLLRATLYEVP